MARKMKDSGVAWIGEIPTKWAIKKLKFVASFCQDKYQEDLGNLDYVGLENIISWSGKFVETESEYDKNQSLLFQRNDILWGKLRPYLAKVFHCQENGCCSGEFCVIRPLSSVNVRFLWNVLISTGFVSTIDQSTYGTKMPRANADFIKNIPIPVPPIAKQKNIGTFLDMKCKEIDAVLEKTRASIEEYKKLKQAIITQAVTKGIQGDRPMKESGIEWIPLIPDNWLVCKTLYCLSMPITDGPHTTPDFYDEGIPFVSAEAVSCGNGLIDFSHIRGYISEEFYIECCKKYVPEIDDIYMIKSGATTGRVAIVDTDRVFTIWSPLAVFRCNPNIAVPKYIFYFLQSIPFQKQIELGWSYGTQQNIGMRTLERLKVCLPPLNEQAEIVEHLNDTISGVDSIIKKKEQILRELESYKKSLIYEYVTGKKEVPQAQPKSTIAFFDARALLLCRIIELLKPKGRIHLMKALYTVDCLLDLNGITQYQRQKHGPYDIQIEEYEKILVQNGWVSIKAGSPVEYTLTKMFETYRKRYQANYGDVDGEVQRICAFLRPMKTSKAERVATLLAVWNDFVIDGITPTDQQIVQEVRGNWTSNKANSPADTWLGTLAEMKANKIIPLGYGKHTSHMS